MKALKQSLPLILMGLALLLSAESPSPQSSPALNGTKNHPVPFVSPTIAPTENQPTTCIKTKELESKDSWFPPGTFWPPIWSNLLLAVVGIGAVFAAFYTLTSINNQVLAAVEALKIIRVAANAAKQQADVAAQELIIANRAYLYLSGVQIRFDEARTEVADSSPIYPYTITYPIYNGGQTPALYISAYARAGTFERPPTEVSPAALALDRPQNTIVPPRGTEPLRPPYNSCLSEDEFFQIRDRAWKLCFYGVLTYLDVFGKTERHTWFNLSFRAPFPEAGVVRYMAFEAAGGLNRFD